mgnify:CR=1 FL=1
MKSRRLLLPYPISANRYWRVYRGRVIQSRDAGLYKRDVAKLAKASGVEVIHGNVEVKVTLRPKMTKSGVEYKKRLDLDNCLKVVLDSLNGVMYEDDSQIVAISAHIGEGLPLGGVDVEVIYS